MILTSATSVKEKMLGVTLEGSLVKGITRFISGATNANLGMVQFIRRFRNLNERGSLRQGKSTEPTLLFRVLRIGWLCVL